MADRPIIFSGPMVRALLDGRKTQTRRIANFVHVEPDGLLHLRNGGGGIYGVREANVPTYGPDYTPFAIGDRLWVREAFTLTQHGKPVYRADACDQSGQRWTSITPGDPTKEVLWKPSIHMPRLASRLTLVVTDVRVQRLQEITSADAIKEGIAPTANSLTIDSDTEDPREQFRTRWNSIHGPGAWDENPWVCALTFTVQKANIDAMGGGNG